VCSTHGTKEVECITNFNPHTSAALQSLLLWHADVISTIFTPVQGNSNLI
jgi:hypothetical protein